MAKDITKLERVGAHPALDFANTVSWRGTARAAEYLRNYDALLAWSKAAGLVSQREARRLRRALALRETIFLVVGKLARDSVPPRAAVARVHAARLAALAHARLEPTPRGAWTPTWRSTAAPPDLDRPWWPVALAFASLLEEPLRYPLGICPDCSWLFIDRTHNRSRRWCSSGDCGNRARGRRFRVRHRSR